MEQKMSDLWPESRWQPNQGEVKLQISQASECHLVRNFVIEILPSDQQKLSSLGSKRDHFCQVEVTTISELGDELERVVKILSFSYL